MVLGAGGDISLDGEHGEKLDFVVAEWAGVDRLSALLLMEFQEAWDPSQVGMFGTNGHMPESHFAPDLIEQFRCRSVVRLALHSLPRSIIQHPPIKSLHRALYDTPAWRSEEPARHGHFGD